jgi:hypothetical protein
VSIIERVIRALLYLIGIAICYYLVIWIFAVIGIHIPVEITRLLMAAFGLIAILVLVRLFWPYVSGGRWFPDDRP